ncbi:MAG: hypothetical protein IK000_06225 [Bacteroidaceae bacterium]|nr:hypothetical protein [Bacteroidaceae bacterium]
MKKRFLLTAILLATMMATSAFADSVNMTDKLVNGDCEQKLAGWKVEFTLGDNAQTWHTTTHTESEGAYEYWGFSGTELEIWSSQNYLPGPTCLSQKLTDLPNGTYGFGAFMISTTNIGDKNDPEDYLNSKGGYIFANDQEYEAQTNSWSSNSWFHSKKFNVTATVTDGTLEVGFRIREGNTVRWFGFDNAELYYFGDVTTDEALIQMYKQDIAFDIHVADTLKAHLLGAEVVAAFDHACEIGRAANTIEEMMAADDSIRSLIKPAYKSINTFSGLAKLVTTAKEVYGADWSEYVKDQVENLGEVIKQAEKDIAENNIITSELEAYMSELQEAIDQVRVDEAYLFLDELRVFTGSPESVDEDNPCFGLTSHPGFGEEVGQYSETYLVTLEGMLDVLSEKLENIAAGTVPATEGMAYMAAVKAVVEDCIRSASVEVSLPYQFITIPSEDDPDTPYRYTGTRKTIVDQEYLKKWQEGECLGNPDSKRTIMRYTSPYITFDKEYAAITFYAIHTTYELMVAENDGPELGICEFYVLDADGNELLTSVDQLSSGSASIRAGEGELSSIVDRNLNTDYYSRWNFKVPGYGPHEIMVTFEEPVKGLRFVIEEYWGQYRLSSIPTEIRLEGLSEGELDLQNALAEAEKKDYVGGTEVGCYDYDSGVFYQMVSQGKALLESGTATENELFAMSDKLYDQMQKMENLEMVSPVEGKQYVISNANAAFLNLQEVVKNLAVNPVDSSFVWKNADPADEYQYFTFEPVLDENGNTDYYIRNTASGLYVGYSWTTADENISMIENKDDARPYELIRYSGNAFNLHVANGEAECLLHPRGHYVNSTTGLGVSGGVRNYKNEPSSMSIWYIREMDTLPATVNAGEGLGDKCYHFPVGSRAFKFTADKTCEFKNFKLFDNTHTEIDAAVKQSSNALIVTLPFVCADFYFSFDNNEVVSTITIEKTSVPGEESELETQLRTTFNTANIAYKEGTEIGEVKSLAAYNEAMNAAETLLLNGANDEQAAAAIQAIEDAVAGLEVVQPKAGEKYWLVSAYDPFFSTLCREMAIFYRPETSRASWTYLDTDETEFQWEFIPAETEGEWYLQCASCDTLYMGYSTKSGGGIFMAGKSARGRYKLVPREEGKINFRCVEEGCNANTALIHPEGHKNGAGFLGNLMNYKNEEPSRSVWYIRKADTNTKVESPICDDSVRPSVEGLFDLMGRRVVAPEKGLYIINGKKVLVK